MFSLNKVMLIGNVGGEPEVRYLDQNPQSQSRVASFTLATSERYRDRNNELKEVTEWHRISAWGKNAELVEKYVKKGTMLYVEGSLRSRSWVGKDGQKREVTEIRAEIIHSLSKREQVNAPSVAAGPASQSAPAQSAKAPQPSQSDTTISDDLPF